MLFRSEFTNEVYPRLRIIRNTKRKKNKNYLYGPFPNVNAARKTVDMLNRIYPLRKCEHLKKEVCLYYHIGQCLGYCTKKVDQECIDSMKKEIISFLKGDSTIIEKKIKHEIEKASASLNYERALELKNMLDDINISTDGLQVFGTTSHRKTLITAVIDAVKELGADGINLDVETIKSDVGPSYKIGRAHV